MAELTRHYILRDIDNRDGDGSPYETVPLPLTMHAGYIDGPLIDDLSPLCWPEDTADELRRIAAEMREGRLSDGDRQRLRELSVYLREADHG